MFRVFRRLLSPLAPIPINNCALFQQLGIFNGDAVLLKGKKRKDTVCIALVEEGLDDSSVRMSKVSSMLSACQQTVVATSQ